MIRHLVLVRFASRTPQSEIEAVFAQLAKLKETVPGLLAFAAGSNQSPEGLSRGYTHAFSVDFASEAARDAYLVHPDHKAAGARLVEAAENGIDGLAVIDFALAEA